MQGTVIAYRRAGYGWLSWNGERVWIHIQDVRDKQGHPVPALKIGWVVQFDVVEGPRGLRAMLARVVDASSTAEVIQCPQTSTR